MSETKQVFVVMPFREDFDDVYMMVRDACSAIDGMSIKCLRADEIHEPGRITDQILEAIRGADALVADLTDSNPNVMYELGFAHALGKPTIIINQTVKDSPFDVAGMRQVLYDRNRLVKDCRPRLISGLSEVLGGSHAADLAKDPPKPAVAATGEPPKTLGPILLSDKLNMEVQKIHLQMELAYSVRDIERLRKLARDLLLMIDRITVFAGTADNDVNNLAAGIGNCGVEAEKGKLFIEAEDLYKRAIGLAPKYGGVRIQYSDYLVDRGRIDEAVAELQRARESSPNDGRLQHLETKIALASGRVDPSLGEGLRSAFEQNPSDDRSAINYLQFLSRTRDSARFEQVSREWANVAPHFKGQALRYLADGLVGLDEHARARPIYEELLAMNLDESDRHAVLHNLATICFALRDSDAAERYWEEAYNINRTDPVVNTAYSQLLSRRGKLEKAIKVVAGEALK